MAFDIQPRTTRNESDNTKVLGILDVFIRYIRAKPISDQREETTIRLLMHELISIFGPMGILLSDGGPNVISTVMNNLSAMLGIGRVQACPFHLQARRTI